MAVTTTPTGKATSGPYAGFSTVPTHAGSYAVTPTITDRNDQGCTTGTLIITPDPCELQKNTYVTTPEQTERVASDQANPDFDGLSNLAVYTLNPNPDQFTPAPVGVIDFAGFSVTFTRLVSLPEISFRRRGI